MGFLGNSAPVQEKVAETEMGTDEAAKPPFSCNEHFTSFNLQTIRLTEFGQVTKMLNQAVNNAII